jgi:hypothetical protein
MRSHQQFGVRLAAICAALLLFLPRAFGGVSLLLEEPFGRFGAFNPTGHAAIYLSDICAETPTQLRMCRAGESGVVISRYHHVHGYDWVAIPLIPYLYAVENLAEVPGMVTPEIEASLRDDYRRAHLLGLAPSLPDGGTPGGEWIQLVGAAYDRRLYGFQVDTTREQDEALVAKLNDSRNQSHFNLFYSNCADFARSILRTYYPKSIAGNSPADFWLTTPKHLARSVVRFGEARPELGFRTFQIPQVPGTIQRSRNVDGIAESLVRSKKYFVPLTFLSPTFSAGLVATYIGTGRFRPPKNSPLMPELLPQATDLALEPDNISLSEFGGVDAHGMPLACTPIPRTPGSSTTLQALATGTE